MSILELLRQHEIKDPAVDDEQKNIIECVYLRSGAWFDSVCAFTVPTDVELAESSSYYEPVVRFHRIGKEAHGERVFVRLDEIVALDVGPDYTD